MAALRRVQEHCFTQRIIAPCKPLSSNLFYLEMVRASYCRGSRNSHYFEPPSPNSQATTKNIAKYSLITVLFGSPGSAPNSEVCHSKFFIPILFCTFPDRINHRHWLNSNSFTKRTPENPKPLQYQKCSTQTPFFPMWSGRIKILRTNSSSWDNFTFSSQVFHSVAAL